jgi:hypothetical protein
MKFTVTVANLRPTPTLSSVTVEARDPRDAIAHAMAHCLWTEPETGDPILACIETQGERLLERLIAFLMQIR